MRETAVSNQFHPKLPAHLPLGAVINGRFPSLPLLQGSLLLFQSGQLPLETIDLPVDFSQLMLGRLLFYPSGSMQRLGQHIQYRLQQVARHGDIMMDRVGGLESGGNGRYPTRIEMFLLKLTPASAACRPVKLVGQTEPNKRTHRSQVAPSNVRRPVTKAHLF